MQYSIHQRDNFYYIDEGQGETLLLLHGLFGALSNWEHVLRYFSHRYRVVIPMLPIYEMPLSEAGLEGLTGFVSNFLKAVRLDNLTLLGNSLGGHIALLLALQHPQAVKRIVLTGSSGLFENTMGGSYPKRGNYEFVKERVEYTFYDPHVATKELIDEVFEVTKSIPKCMRIVAIAKSAQRNNLSKELHKIKAPTLLIWGLNDTITPPNVAHEFEELLPHAELRFIDCCGHAPMMENPALFNYYVEDFLRRHP
ncbi:MAG: alpha/beta hydrolase [Cytophagales bacterium]|nr:alpha/beta hydrolase [Bernardetiaceae bacterium]MDW8210210.1 alpha/beta hydrolase [Cytophagales bacterium]